MAEWDIEPHRESFVLSKEDQEMLQVRWSEEACAQALAESQAESEKRDTYNRTLFVRQAMRRANAGRNYAEKKQRTLLPLGFSSAISGAPRCDGCARHFERKDLMQEIFRPVRRFQFLCARCEIQILENDRALLKRLRQLPVEEWLEAQPPAHWRDRYGHTFRPIRSEDLRPHRFNIPKSKEQRRTFRVQFQPLDLLTGLMWARGNENKENEERLHRRVEYDKELGYLWMFGGRRAVWEFSETPSRQSAARYRRWLAARRQDGRAPPPSVRPTLQDPFSG